MNDKHAMIRKYRTTELDREIFPDITLRDMLFISCFVMVMRLFSFLVQVKLRPVYTIFNVIAGLVLTRSVGKTNYPKRLYHRYMYGLVKLTEDNVYLPVQRKEAIFDEEINNE